MNLSREAKKFEDVNFTELLRHSVATAHSCTPLQYELVSGIYWRTQFSPSLSLYLTSSFSWITADN